MKIIVKISSEDLNSEFLYKTLLKSKMGYYVSLSDIVEVKSKSGFSIGILDAITREEKATYIDSLGNEKTLPIEPFSNALVLRLKK